MFQLLRQPFPRTSQSDRRIKTALAIGAFVFLFLFIFRPFGLQEMGTKPLAFAAFYYGLVCSLVLLAYFVFIPRLIPSIFEESRWTVWKEILQNIICTLAVTMGNIIFTHYYFGEPLNGHLVVKFLWLTFSVGVIPVTLQALIRQVQLRKAFSRQAEELNRQLPASETGRFPEEGGPDETYPVLIFSADNGQERIELSLATFLYAEAADNYVKFFYTAEGKPEQKMIRSSLKRLEDTISGYTGLYRCHRTYIVNLRKVMHISGNAQGYKLHLDGVSTLIPVSRNLNKEIAGLVTGPKGVPDSPINL